MSNLLLQIGSVLQHSDPSVLFVFMLSFTLATISLCFLISTLFSRANLAAACAGIFYFCSYLPYTIVIQWESDMKFGQKVLAVSSN